MALRGLVEGFLLSLNWLSSLLALSCLPVDSQLALRLAVCQETANSEPTDYFSQKQSQSHLVGSELAVS